MAGTAYAGSVDSVGLSASVLGLLIGQNRGTAPFGSRWNTTDRPAIAVLPDLISGAPTVDTQTDGQASTENEYAGVQSVLAGAGADWYEDLHILPRTALDFGNLITEVTEEYEIYNAYRATDISLTTVDLTAVQPGITTPEMTPVYVVEAQTSAFDSSTTDNSGGSGLGTIVKLEVVAASDGLPSFDSDITFSGGGEEVSLTISGSRIVLMPMIYESPLVETLEWATDMLEGLDGSEQRVALRAHPRQKFKVSYLLDDNDRQRMLALLFDWSDSTFGFPLWHERVTLTASVSPGGTTYQFLGGDEVDFRVGGLAVVISDNETFDVINITAVSATSMTAGDPATNGYAIGTPIMPLRTAVLGRAARSKVFYKELERFDVEFYVTDNDTGAVSGSTTPGWWSTYNSRVLFDDCNFSDGPVPTEYPRRIVRIDNSTGVISQSSPWDRAKRGQRKGFYLKTRAEVYTFRQLMTALAGRQKAFYLPTFQKDLTVAAAITSASSTIDIVAIEYVRHVISRVGMNLFKITFTDGTSLVREVQSAASVSSSVERLTLDTTWPDDRAVDEVERIEFYEVMRFDSDEITIQHERIGRARCSIPVVRVFDDN